MQLVSLGWVPELTVSLAQTRRRDEAVVSVSAHRGARSSASQGRHPDVEVRAVKVQTRWLRHGASPRARFRANSMYSWINTTVGELSSHATPISNCP
ncbi:uncharacterized protein CCOS01_02299 [Colletotrichum costaricense]|uniref:Uncharacterized protein n=1 Tax=Colletotrichum costaricense TaxID=1209916 RepID=A0AAJ0E557_9PEZI|nr:uncharacterized protein CCOS01_02299 [Colletotrichum costaricense]KAK1536979.1 hypothetical protein CCOS01_02299 [Colletotrichum costaricense]